MNLESQIKKICNLPQYKDKSEEFLRKKAMVTLQKKQFKISDKFNDEQEIKQAEKLFDNYLNEYDFEGYIELTTLGDLVYNEILKMRVEKKLNSGVSNNKDTKPFINDRDVKTLHDLTNKIDELRKKLGMIGNIEDDELTILQKQEKQLDTYIEENENDFIAWIPYFCHKCGYVGTESYLLYREVKDFKTLKHPWYAGRFLFNYPLFKKVKEEKISKEDAIEILLGVGLGKKSITEENRKYCTDYIDYCLNNWALIISFLKDAK